MKTSRPGRDYGLPPLTVEEAARVLQVAPAELMNWFVTRVKPTPQQWTNWTRPDATLPEALIRLYLTDRQGGTFAIPIAESPPPVPPAAAGTVEIIGPRRGTRRARSR